ncbi:MAG TPA: CheR family methyltransferase [Kofleriaceae bacterium]|nr:CheR family methyltransferase [Kofleriaceae bacterium]
MIGAETAGPVEQVVRTLPERGGFALVIACTGDRNVAATLRSHSALPITEVRERAQLEPDRVFVIPDDCEGAFQRGELLVMGSTDPRAPIDRLLRSLVDELGGQVAGVILSGRGSDGVIGIKRVKEAGGLTIAQAPDGENTEMPRSAIATGMIDLVLPLSEIGARLAAFGHQDIDVGAPAEEVERRGTEAAADTLRDILALVRIRSGHDFASYKRATLYRRVSRRMQVCECDTIARYHQYLREHPAELGNLLRDFLISVTNFFRDRHVFDALESAVIPRLFTGKTSMDQVRVWVSGCATGEEAYSIGMLLCEQARRTPDSPQLQVFATDIDEDALAEARVGRYPNTIAVDVTPERLLRFFAPDGANYRVSKELREIMLFSPHNLLRDPPFSRLDLISCRNLLIYLNRDAQDRALNVFHFGLRPEGFLLLGSSESAENTSLFTGVDLKHRLFLRRPSASRLGSDTVAPTGRWQPPAPPPARLPLERPAGGELHHRLVERFAPPSILVNEELEILHVSEHAGALLRVPGGEPSRQLLRLIHPALRSELLTAIYAARQAQSGSDTRVVRFEDGESWRVLEIRVRMVDQPDLDRGTLLVFFDELDPSRNTVYSQVPSVGLEPVMREIEDELRRTREQLRATIEQYETSLEELKASNEELQAINEELRSATEELETSKEELQSVNEELTTLNHELKLKVDEISHANSDLQNLMTSTEIGVIFLDRELNIKRFTPRAQELFNVIIGDVGRPLGHLTHRLDSNDLPQLAHTVLQTLRTVEREVRTREGSRYLARLLPYRSLDDRIGGVVLTFVEVTDLRNAVDAQRRSEVARQASEERLRFALRTAPMLVVSHDAALQTLWGYVLGEEFPAGSRRFQELLAPGNTDKFTEIARRALVTGQGQRAELDVVINGERRTYDFRVQANEHGTDAVGFDITPGKLAEAALLDADRRKDEFLATLSHELRNPLTPLKMALDIAKLAGHDYDRLEQSRGIMERQVAQLTQLIDDLLDLSRIAQGKIELDLVPVDAAVIVEAAIEATRPLIQQRNHALKVDLPEVSCRVLGDKRRLTQVLTNLINNAAKYTPEGGHIALALHADRTRKLLIIRLNDDGDGISTELIPRVFDIFVQSRDAEGRSLGGLGIGLNLVRRLVDLHGGSVSVSSPGAGRGSEFIVELPLATEKGLLS